MNLKTKNALIFGVIVFVSFNANFIKRGIWGRDICNQTGFPLISTQGGLCINEEPLGYGPLIFNTLFWTLILSLITFLLIKIFKKR